jgi:S-adenosylmethionine synthetase
MTSAQVRERVEPYVREALPKDWINGKTIWHINPTGKFYIGGPAAIPASPAARSSSTPRRRSPAWRRRLSGKDPTASTVWRLCRALRRQEHRRRRSRRPPHAAACLRHRRRRRPLSIYIDTHGTGKVPEDKLEKAVAQAMDLTPRGIRSHLDLNRPIYARTAAYGHFGRTPDNEGGFSWEKTDLVEPLKRAI